MVSRTDFFYDLPEALIAQHPAEPRDSSRLLTLNRRDGSLRDGAFGDIVDALDPGDLLVLNNSKVIPARLLGTKRVTGAKAEVLLLRQLDGDRWECIVKPGNKLRAGAAVDFSGDLSCTILEEQDGGVRIISFDYDHANAFFAVLDKVGQMPLPRYIKAPLQDKQQYQTVYAAVEGSAAAPTAGFHFTDALLAKIAEKGVQRAEITLHVGLGTFRPVKEDDITKHHMHREYYTIPPETAARLQRTKKSGGRVIAVGTTSCRTLEASAQKNGAVTAGSDSTDIFIYPEYDFRVIDALITNFHLPESTLIMLVSAFAGYDNTLNAYRHAVEDRYRFFSFGDAMYIY